MIVNSLPLPPSLLILIESGRWRCPADQSGLDRLFPERGEFCCYSFAGMEGETQVIYRNPTPMWRGMPDPANPPGDIDPKLAVLIADLGIGYDQPIALDYRLSREQPRVLTLRWDKPDPPVGGNRAVAEWEAPLRQSNNSAAAVVVRHHAARRLEPLDRDRS